jgi:hypothetical protein
MSKKLQLQIPTPCHENWDDMSPVKKGRFCSSCQKQVVDFSRMSDREVAMFFKKPSTGSVCGRFMEDQLNKDIEIPKKRIPWVKYFFQFLLPGFLISMRATAQGKVKVTKEDPAKVVCSSRTLGEVSFKPTMGDTIIAAPLLTTTLGIKRDPKERGYVTTNLQKNNPNSSKGKISNGGKRTLKRKSRSQKVTAISELNEQLINQEHFNKSDEKPIKNIPNLLPPQLKGIAGGVVVVRVGSIAPTYIKKQSKSKQIVQRIFKDTLFNKFKVYPNPVQSNSTLHIEWNKTENGYHVLELFNLSGQLLFTKEMFIDAEAKLLSVDLPSLTTGNYFLKMTNKKTSRSYTSKILVE